MDKTAPYQVKRFGNEQEPVVIIDDFSGELATLRADAVSRDYARHGPFYPGIRAPMQPNYLGNRMALLEGILTRNFDCGNGASFAEAAYSIVTTRPEDLTPIQRLPHYDGVDPGRLALLHYLSDDDHGGTAFYRHKATGYETVTADRFDIYKAKLEEEVKAFGMPQQDYFRGQGKQFELIGKVDAKPDRLVIYRAITLHSGFIPEGFECDPSPETGRLTVNIFLQRK